jgi:hypothetical protein
MSPFARFALAPSGYTRRALQDGDRVLVESTCDYCGFRIVGNVSENVIEDERAHLAKCPHAAAKAGGAA